MPVLNDADDVKLGAQDVTAIYAGTELVWIGTPPSHFSGGVEYVEGGYRYHMFRLPESGQQLIFMPDADNTPVEVEYCIIAGGGSGGSDTANGRRASGGGAGGMLTGTTTLDADVSDMIVGAGGLIRSQSQPDFGRGGDTVFNGLTAFGGGGGSIGSAASNGGSGGGANGAGANPLPGGTGVPGQGNDGGTCSAYSSIGAGGGGAGEAGKGYNDGAEVNWGGDGREWPVGSGNYYAGGGGGGQSGASPRTYGGLGGGGRGGGGDNLSNGVDSTGEDGALGTGGGGGGCGFYAMGGRGGSGVIMVRYLDNAKFPPVSPPPPTAIYGGMQYWEDGYLYNVFRTTETDALIFAGADDIEYCIVGGGGSGGGSQASNSNGGGGGGGGVRIGSITPTDGFYPVVVGAGGSGSYNRCARGGSSSFAGIVVTGGGGGTTPFNTQPAEQVGATGGGGYTQGGGSTGGAGTDGTGDGFPGAGGQYWSANSSSHGVSGGGGGAGGTPPDPALGGVVTGGIGVEWPVGSGRYHGGGGTGSHFYGGGAPDTFPQTPFIGGLGGGGCGTYKDGAYVSYGGTDGLLGFGGGGAGAQGLTTQNYPRKGGDGVVILRVPALNPAEGFAPDDLSGLSFWLDADDAATITFSFSASVSTWGNKRVPATPANATGQNGPIWEVPPGLPSGRKGIKCDSTVNSVNRFYMNPLPPVPAIPYYQTWIVAYWMRVDASGTFQTWNPVDITNNGASRLQSQGVAKLDTKWGSLASTQSDSCPWPSDPRLGAEATQLVIQTVMGTTDPFAGKVNTGVTVLNMATGGKAFRTDYVNEGVNAVPPMAYVGGDANTGTPFNAHLLEVITYDRPLPQSEIARLATYLRGKWFG